MKTEKEELVLSQEQQLFLAKALTGSNILVDACIGSGKTTAIQHLCARADAGLSILYLTYNKLLKLDAKKKIRCKNVAVHNYHGFAYACLKRAGISTGVSDLIQRFNKETPVLDHYDMLIIDEYQDIDSEIAQMLEYIKEANPSVQIIAVGDMEQKIYDKTALDVQAFIRGFLGEHTKLEFTRCFRLSTELAAKLGRVWKKSIIGVNDCCIVEEMATQDVVKFLAEQDPGDILCLGARTGDLAKVLNELETIRPEKFNKKTVYASISDQDSSLSPRHDSAIFTTFDSSKGLERRICVIFDHTENYWDVRINKPQQSYTILRNIFCVAASRGKERIIFATNGEDLLSEKTLSTEIRTNMDLKDVDISSMFDFKYKEDVEKCCALLKITPLSQGTESSVIRISNRDGLIDLAPCIGIYQEASFFRDYDIDKDIAHWLLLNPSKEYLISTEDAGQSIDKKILLLVSLETRQNRYTAQVDAPFVNSRERTQLLERLGSLFDPGERVQVPCSIPFYDPETGKHLFSARGIADVVKERTVYELKFVSELKHEHFLQCACYAVALGLERGILWNIRSNDRYEITIPDRMAFLDGVTAAVTKSYLQKYYLPTAHTEAPAGETAKEKGLWKSLQLLIRKQIGKTR